MVFFFYKIWSWRNYWIIIHTGAVQRPVTFSDWITSIHNLRTAARVLDHTCYVINLKKSFDSICMKRYKVWFILVFENFGRLLSHVPIRILPFWPFTPSYDYPGSVNDFSAAALDFEWNICTSFFLFIKKDVGVESFHDEKFKFNFFKLLQIRWRPTFYKEESDDRDSCTVAGLLSRVHMLTHRPRLFKSIVTFNKW